MDTKKIVILGLGGQGVLFAGKVIAYSAFLSGFKASFLPNFGPEIHNGPVKAELIISKEEIYNPFVKEADYVIVFHKFRLKEAEKHLSNHSTLFYKDFKSGEYSANNSLYIDTDTVTDNINNHQLSNIAFIGAFNSYTGLFEDKIIGESLKQLLVHKKYNIVSLNYKAYKQGKELFEAQNHLNV